MNDDTLKGLSDGTFRAHWLREVLRAAQITESVKTLLFSVAIEEMDDSGVFSVPREEIATRIGRGKARVSERIQEAVERGFLIRVSAGKKGHTAVYAAALKGSACADLIKGPAIRTEISFGSDLQDAKPENRVRSAGRFEDQTNVSVRSAGRFESNTVRTAGPEDEKKGPHTRAAKVEGSREEVELPQDSAGDDFLKTEDAASRRASQEPKRTKRAKIPKIPLPADFAPDEAMHAWARENCPLVDIDAQTVAFIVHFTPEPGEKPEERPGWSRSWKAWMVRQQGWLKERQGNVRHLRPTGTDGSRLVRSTTDERVAQAQALKAKFATQTPPTIRGEITR